MFRSLLNKTVESVHVFGEDIKMSEKLTYLFSIVHDDIMWNQEVVRWSGLGHSAMDLLSTSIWFCWYLCRQTKIRIFMSLVTPVLLYGCETWTLNTDLKRRIDVFGTRCLRRIMKYH